MWPLFDLPAFPALLRLPDLLFLLCNLEERVIPAGGLMPKSAKLAKEKERKKKEQAVKREQAPRSRPKTEKVS